MTEINMEIITMSLKEAWELFKIIRNEDDTDTYKKIRYGIDELFDINDYLKGRMIIKPKSGVALLRGKPMSLGTIDTELEKREKLMKQYINDNTQDVQITRPRSCNGDS